MLFERTKDLALPPVDVTTFLAVGCCLLSIVALLLIGYKKRHWFLRPSLLTFSWYVLRVQVPSIFYLRKTADVVPIPWHYLFIIHGFAISFLAIAIPLYFASDGHTKEIWDKMWRQIEAKQSSLPGYFVVFLLCCTGLTMLAYFSTISFYQTGLYFLLTDPMGLNMARELSLKLLPNRFVIYMYSWNASLFVPLLVMTATIMIVQRRRLDYIPVAAAAILSSSMAATRNNFGAPVLLALLTYFFLRTKRIRPIRLAVFALVGGFLVLLGPAFISIAREGRPVTGAALVGRITGSMFNRAVMAPAHTTLMYVYHTQVTETRGIVGIRPIAILLGEPYNEVTQELGREYVGHATTVVNTNFIGAYYILFGLVTIPVCIIGVLLFDLFGLIFRIRNLAILPFFVLFITKSLSLSESIFTSALLTKGFLFIPILALLSVWFASTNEADGSNKARVD